MKKKASLFSVKTIMIFLLLCITAFFLSWIFTSKSDVVKSIESPIQTVNNSYQQIINNQNQYNEAAVKGKAELQNIIDQYLKVINGDKECNLIDRFDFSMTFQTDGFYIKRAEQGVEFQERIPLRADRLCTYYLELDQNQKQISNKIPRNILVDDHVITLPDTKLNEFENGQDFADENMFFRLDNQRFCFVGFMLPGDVKTGIWKDVTMAELREIAITYFTNQEEISWVKTCDWKA